MTCFPVEVIQLGIAAYKLKEYIAMYKEMTEKMGTVAEELRKDIEDLKQNRIGYISKNMTDLDIEIDCLQRELTDAAQKYDKVLKRHQDRRFIGRIKSLLGVYKLGKKLKEMDKEISHVKQNFLIRTQIQQMAAAAKQFASIRHELAGLKQDVGALVQDNRIYGGVLHGIENTPTLRRCPIYHPSSLSIGFVGPVTMSWCRGNQLENGLWLPEAAYIKLIVAPNNPRQEECYLAMAQNVIKDYTHGTSEQAHKTIEAEGLSVKSINEDFDFDLENLKGVSGATEQIIEFNQREGRIEKEHASTKNIVLSRADAIALAKNSRCSDTEFEGASGRQSPEDPTGKPKQDLAASILLQKLYGKMQTQLKAAMKALALIFGSTLTFSANLAEFFA